MKSSARPIVEEHPKGSGKFRVRARVGGKMKTLASQLPEAEAQDCANAYVVVRNADQIRQGITLGQYGPGFLARREQAGIRAIRTDRAIWSKHIDGDPIAEIPLVDLRRRHIMEWLDRRTGLAHRSRIKLLNLLRTGLRDAVDREILEQNPAREVRVHRAGGARATDDLEGILTPDEQQALLLAVDVEFRPLVAFALFTGLRQAEQWWLMWEDPLGPTLFEDRVVVRRSTGGLPPKSGKIRDVYLLPGAKWALETLAATGLTAGAVFRGARGAQRQEGKAPPQWGDWLKAAGITRRVRWHDLRHTCATSLLAGWWGHKWSLDEVCSLLGHSSVKVTERYARKLAESQKLAVLATNSFVIPGGGNRELIMGNGSTVSAFVKHRSRVQISQSAPAILAGSGDQKGISAEDDFAESFGAAIAEHLARVEPSARITAPDGDDDNSEVTHVG